MPALVGRVKKTNFFWPSVFSGTSVAEMAKRLHRSKSAVYHRALKLKIVPAKSRRVKARGK